MRAISELQDGASYLVNQTVGGHFAISIDSDTYDIDPNKSLSFGVPVCPSGMVRVDPEDARCGKCWGVLCAGEHFQSLIHQSCELLQQIFLNFATIVNKNTLIYCCATKNNIHLEGLCFAVIFV